MSALQKTTQIISNTTLYLINQMPFTSGCRTLSGLHPTHRVRFNLLVGWHAGRFFVTRYFPPILWFHLLLIQFLSQDEWKASWAPAPDVSCIFFPSVFLVLADGRVIALALQWETASKYKCGCTCCKWWLVEVGIPRSTLRPDPSIFHKAVPRKQDIVVCIIIIIISLAERNITL